MNSKLFVALFLIFGIVIGYTQAGRLSLRDDSDDDDDASRDTSNGDDDQAADLESKTMDERGAVAFFDSSLDEKRSIQNFLEDDDEASQFLDRSSRLFSDQKSHMKEAKKKFVSLRFARLRIWTVRIDSIRYEEKCERLLHPRYCPDLATWPAWNQAFASASGKKK